MPDWSEAHAEQHLRSLELFGMRFGLEKMRRVMTALGSPQRCFDCLHIVGTNGKTSTALMLAAILERHGLRSASYTSPHLVSYRERVRVGERELGGGEFAASVARAAWAAERVNRTLAQDDHVTQFELLTAAAFWAMAKRGVQVGVIEAGLGGRYDATSVIESKLTVLTNVGLEHTRWLGPTIGDIAAEKLAVLRPGTTLVHGEDLAPPARTLAASVAAERGARVLQVRPSASVSLPLASRGSFQRRNFALARAAAEVYLRQAGVAVSERAIRDAAASTAVAGRMQVVAEDPLTLLDAAHNPHAAHALVDAWRELPGGTPLALVMGVLDDKDAASMLAALLPLSERAWFTAPPSSRALPPAALESHARRLGFTAASCTARPAEALLQARRWAREHDAVVLATGSVYLVGDLLAHLDSAAEEGACEARASAAGAGGESSPAPARRRG